jgi:two-component system, NarL family, sensor histidine kinase DegS
VELVVPSSLDQNLDDITQQAEQAIGTLEAQLIALAVRVEEHRHFLDAQRSRVQREREELDIEFSLESGSSYVIEAPNTGELRAAERALTEQLIRTTSLQRQFSEFSNLLSSSARQFHESGEFLGLDIATQAAIRSAAAGAQETERHRLAREIHDGPAQALANAIIALEFVERAIRSNADNATSRAMEEVERIKSTLREGLTEIRRFIFDLRPTMLQDRGLAATLEHYIATYQSLFPMAIDFRADPELPRLTHDQELTAFRVVQEAIQNARKHARATRTLVQIHVDDDVLVVTIEDNGRGFSPERVTTHMMGGVGLKGMEERAVLVGATINIRSSPGEGTSIALAIPLGIGSGGVSASEAAPGAPIDNNASNIGVGDPAIQQDAASRPA